MSTKNITPEQMLSVMGIEVWQDKETAAATKIATPANPVANLDWQKLEQTVKNCTLCALSKSRTQTVFGVGSQKAKLMFIGEAPGANEDLQGKPFVGRAGMLLNAMLQAIGLNRDEVYIANILKCRPPNNRDPEPSEVEHCTPYLLQQIELINPKLIVAVGRIAAQFLLNTTEAMSRLRGRQYHYGPKQTPLLVTYHPAYLLRSPREKSKAYIDFLAIQKALQEL